MFDPTIATRNLFPSFLHYSYSFTSFNGAAAVIKYNSPNEFDRLVRLLTLYKTRLIDICRPGGNRSPTTIIFGRIARKVGYLSEVELSASYQWAISSGGSCLLQWRTSNDLHAHKVDHWSERVALDFEWNSKDQTYDRDLLAVRHFYDLGIISAAVIVTRDLSAEFTSFFPSLEIFDSSKTYSKLQLRSRIQKRGLDLIQIERDAKLQSLHSKMGLVPRE